MEENFKYRKWKTVYHFSSYFSVALRSGNTAFFKDTAKVTAEAIELN